MLEALREIEVSTEDERAAAPCLVQIDLSCWTTHLLGNSLDDSSKVEALRPRQAEFGNDPSKVVGHGPDRDRSSHAAGNPAMPGRLNDPEEFDARWPAWKDNEEIIAYEAPAELSPSDYAALKRAAIRGLLVAVCTQSVVCIAIAAVAFVASGSAAGVSALAGAATYAIPNALFALGLIRSVNKPAGANPMTFFLGEFFKIAFAGLLVVAAASLGREALVWPAFLAGLVGALKSQWLALFFTRQSPEVQWQKSHARDPGQQ